MHGRGDGGGGGGGGGGVNSECRLDYNEIVRRSTSNLLHSNDMHGDRMQGECSVPNSYHSGHVSLRNQN